MTMMQRFIYDLICREYMAVYNAKIQKNNFPKIAGLSVAAAAAVLLGYETLKERPCYVADLPKTIHSNFGALKDFKEFMRKSSEKEFNAEVDSCIENFVKNITDYSDYFSELTKYNDYVKSGLENTINLAESLARSNIIIESKADLFAKSYMGALGASQFMIKTAQKYGIEINEVFDYRRHPISITEGIKHLGDLRVFYGNDMLALVGYNSGPDLADRLYVQFGENASWQDIKYYLPRETYNHIIKVSALEKMYENPEKYGLEIEQRPLFSEKVGKEYSIRRGQNLAMIAKKNRVSFRDIVEVNPHIKNFRKMPPGTHIYIPKPKSGMHFHK